MYKFAAVYYFFKPVRIYYILSLLIAVFFSTACSKQPDYPVTCTHEQYQRLDPQEAKPLTPDTSATTTINVNPLFNIKEFDFQSAISNIRFIPLQTTPESHVGRTDRLIVTKSHIYLSDTNYLFIFTHRGQFISKILFPKGAYHDFAFDNSLSEIVICADNYVGHYYPDGQLKWTEHLPFRFSSIAIANNLLAVHCDSNFMNPHFPPALASSPCFFIDRQGELTSYVTPLSHRPTSPLVCRRFQPALDGVALCRSFCDTILYVLSPTRVEARYVLDYSSLRLPDPTTEQNINDIFAGRHDKGLYYFGGDFIPSANGFFFVLRTERAMTIRAFYDARTNKLLGGIQPLADYCEIPPLYNPVSSYGDSYASLFHPYQTESGRTFRFLGNSVSETQKDILDGVRHDDNPVVALFDITVD